MEQSRYRSGGLDNGAFSAWKRGHTPDWKAYYEWCDRWLQYPTTWAISG
jgi:hypothetical protein